MGLKDFTQADLEMMPLPAQVAIKAGDHKVAIDIFVKAGMPVPQALLDLASAEETSKLPDGWSARFENYLGRVRLVIRRNGKDSSLDG